MSERTLEYYDQLADVFSSTPHEARLAMWNAQDDEAREQLAQRGHDLSAAEGIPEPPEQTRKPATETTPSGRVVAQGHQANRPSSETKLERMSALVDVDSLSDLQRELVESFEIDAGTDLSTLRRLADSHGLPVDPKRATKAAAYETPGGGLAGLGGPQIDLGPEDFAQAEKAVSQIEKDAARTGFAGEQVTYGPDGRMRPAKVSKTKKK